MRILQVIHGFPPHNVAGSEVYTYTVSRELAKVHEVHVFHRIDDPQRGEYELQHATYDGLEVWTINNTFKYCHSFEQTYRNDAIGKRFGHLLAALRPDVVHFGHVLNLSTTLVAEAKMRGIPVIFTLHDFWLFCPLGQLLKHDLSLCDGPEESECARCSAPQLAIRPILRRAFEGLRQSVPRFQASTRLRRFLRKVYHRYARFVFSIQREGRAPIRARTQHVSEMCAQVDLFVAPSQFLLEKFVEFGIPRSKIVHEDNGFDRGLVADVAHKPSSRLRFGYTGTFIPSKGVHVLLEAFHALEAPDVELRLHGRFTGLPYGHEDYPVRLKALSQRENVVWCGEYEHAEIGRVLSEIDVLVVPSIWHENSPLTIHEAFLAGVPVMTANIGGMAELVQDGVNGLLFEVDNVQDLARRMQTVIDDRTLIEKLKRNLGPVIPIEQHAATIEELYGRVLAAGVDDTP
jgi:glycosyltransferase involved in cell wall biosynthesis